MEPKMTKKDFDNAVEKIEAALVAQNVTEQIRVEDWDLKDWSLKLTWLRSKKVRSNVMLDAIEKALYGLGLQEDDVFYAGFGREEGGYIWFVTHPDIPQCVRDRIDREIEEEEQEESEQRQREHKERQKQAAKESKQLLKDLAAGRLKSATEDGFLVLAGEFFDAIEAGDKTVECREFSAYNLKRTIGLKSVRLQRGYGHPGMPPKKMRYKVTKVTLADDDGHECDPFEVPRGFVPVCIYLHLGGRLS